MMRSRDHHAEAMAFFLRGEIGLKDFGGIPLGNTGAGIDKLEINELVVAASENAHAAGLHRLHRVSNAVEKQFPSNYLSNNWPGIGSFEGIRRISAQFAGKQKARPGELESPTS